MAQGDDQGLQNPAPRATGRKQKEQVEVADNKDVLLKDALDSQEGVGERRVLVNPALRGDVEFNKFDENGNLEASEVFEAGKVHLVSAELADSDYFVDAPEDA
jgi:esterase/lipase superfamily enzyme